MEVVAIVVVGNKKQEGSSSRAAEWCLHILLLVNNCTTNTFIFGHDSFRSGNLTGIYLRSDGYPNRKNDPVVFFEKTNSHSVWLRCGARNAPNEVQPSHQQRTSLSLCLSVSPLNLIRLLFSSILRLDGIAAQSHTNCCE